MTSCSHWGMFPDPQIQRAVAAMNREMSGGAFGACLTEDFILGMRRA